MCNKDWESGDEKEGCGLVSKGTVSKGIESKEQRVKEQRVKRNSE